MNRLVAEIDLAQAESRFIAWSGPVPKLQQMYREGRDIHRYVASTIFEKPENEITADERQLGKKSGHGANYKMGAGTFASSCLKEMDLVLPIGKCQAILDGYFAAWGGDLERWQARQIEIVFRTRTLTTVFGRKRHFYDRVGPAMEREALAYEPQATIPDIINFLIKDLFRYRPTSSLRLLNQCHDSVWIEFDACDQKKVLDFIIPQPWNPTLDLPGGALRIPIEIKVGSNFKLEKKNVVYSG